LNLLEKAWISVRESAAPIRTDGEGTVDDHDKIAL
jgi:hypothetical protein